MEKVMYTTKSSSPSLQGAAKLAFGAAAASLLLLAALHILKADLDPTWHMVSQYATGKFGWVQTLVFLTLALSCLSLISLIHPANTNSIRLAEAVGAHFEREHEFRGAKWSIYSHTKKRRSLSNETHFEQRR